MHLLHISNQLSAAITELHLLIVVSCISFQRSAISRQLRNRKRIPLSFFSRGGSKATRALHTLSKMKPLHSSE